MFTRCGIHKVQEQEHKIMLQQSCNQPFRCLRASPAECENTLGYPPDLALSFNIIYIVQWLRASQVSDRPWYQYMSQGIIWDYPGQRQGKGRSIVQLSYGMSYSTRALIFTSQCYWLSHGARGTQGCPTVSKRCIFRLLYVQFFILYSTIILSKP